MMWWLPFFVAAKESTGISHLYAGKVRVGAIIYLGNDQEMSIALLDPQKPVVHMKRLVGVGFL